MTAVIGIDPSLTSTGLALVVDGELVKVGNIKTKGRRGMKVRHKNQRFNDIEDGVAQFIDEAGQQYDLDTVMIEGPSFGSLHGQQHERGGLWWRIVDLLEGYSLDIAVCPPALRAKWITGSGRADKETVLAFAIERWVGDNTPRIPNHDVADAVGLATLGSTLLGVPCDSKEFLLDDWFDRVEWPDE